MNSSFIDLAKELGLVALAIGGVGVIARFFLSGLKTVMENMQATWSNEASLLKQTVHIEIEKINNNIRNIHRDLMEVNIKHEERLTILERDVRRIKENTEDIADIRDITLATNQGE